MRRPLLLRLVIDDIANREAMRAAGRPNRAATTFASSIIREPLPGREAVCLVSPDTDMAQPRRVVDPLLDAHDLPGASFGTSRPLQLPGFSVAVGKMAAAVRRTGGDQAYTRIRWEPDPLIQRIVSGWPQALAAHRAVDPLLHRRQWHRRGCPGLHRRRSRNAKTARLSSRGARRHHLHDTIKAYAGAWLREQNPRPGFSSYIPLEALLAVKTASKPP